jgi:uncharacterized protein DUF2795
MTRSDKHTPRVDDQLKREVEGHVHGSPSGGRAEEWRQPEAPANGEPEATAVPVPDSVARSDAEIVMTPEEVEGRSRLGRYLHRTALPADKTRLLEAAQDARAPDDVMEELERLPDDETFETAARVWAALGHDLDHRF